MKTEELSAILEGCPDKFHAALDFVLYYAGCPCCEQADECLAECTFAADCPDDHKRHKTLGLI